MSHPTGYSRLQIRLHWATAILVALQFVFHEGISTAYDRAVETGVYAPSFAVMAHSLPGVVILILTIWRFSLRRSHGAPLPREGEPAIFKKLSHLAHMGFYGLLVLLPLSGMAAWGGQIEAAGEVHEILKTLMLLLIIAHIIAALIHQFVWKTNLMDRMRRPS